jgi:hypothetical protein
VADVKERKKRNITTITINRSTHLELYRLKRKLKKRSFDKLLRYLISMYYTTRRRRDPVQHSTLQEEREAEGQR